MGMINGGMDVKWVKTQPASTMQSQTTVKKNDNPNDEVIELSQQSSGKMSRLKNWVKNAVNCCIE